MRLTCPRFVSCLSVTVRVHACVASIRRPGFDDFLHRLRSCGLRYRLQRMSRVLPSVLLEEIRRITPVTVVGGPVMRPRGGGGGRGGACGSTEVGGGNGGSGKEGVGAAAPGAVTAAAAGFDEFVLCSVFSDDGETTT